MTNLHDAIVAAVAAALRGLYVGMPGRLEAYEPATGKGKIKPLIQEPDHTGTMRSLKPISGVPVVMPGGSQAALYLPLQVGDTGWLSFSHRSMELWLARGGDAPPGDPRVMDMTDAVFWPGLRPFSAGSLAEEPDAAVLRNGAAKLKLRGGKVALGNATSIPLPSVPPIVGKLELMNLLDYLLTQLANPSLVVGTATINPAFTVAMQGLQANVQALKGSL